MAKQVYGIGYYGREPTQLRDMAIALDAIVFDIRLSPRSRDPRWGKANLSAVLLDRYRHVKALGNVNYKGGAIKLRDFQAGVEAILMSPKCVILMCVCKHSKHCHRSVIGQQLIRSGFAYSELGGAEAQFNPAARRAFQMSFQL